MWTLTLIFTLTFTLIVCIDIDTNIDAECFGSSSYLFFLAMHRSVQAQDAPCEGMVVAAGPGRTHPLTGTLIPMCVSEGDTVLFSRWSGRKVRTRYGTVRYGTVFYDGTVLVVVKVRYWLL